MNRVFVDASEGRPAWASAGMALWCCCPIGNISRQSKTWKRGHFPGSCLASGRFSAQKRLLKAELKIAHRTEAFRKHRLEMLEGVAEWIEPRTGWGFLLAAQPGADLRQAAAQPLQEMINRFQRKRQAQILNRRFDASGGQKLNQKLGQKRGGDGMAWQNISQKNRKSFSAASTATAIRAKDTLASAAESAVVFRRIIALEDAVPV